MDIIMVGSIMVIMPLIIALLIFLGILFSMLYNDTVQAYKEKDIKSMIITLFILSFTVGMMLIVYGKILEVTI